MYRTKILISVAVLAVVGAAASARALPSDFYSWFNLFTPGDTAVERFQECFAGDVLVGFGGRVAGGNFTDVTVHCKPIAANGSLGATYTRISGGSSQELSIVADPGKVVVGIGGIVTNNNVYRLVIQQCTWNAASRTVNVNGDICTPKSTTGLTSTELFLNSHTNQPIVVAQKRVLTGAGMTASGDNLASIQVKVGSLN